MTDKPLRDENRDGDRGGAMLDAPSGPSRFRRLRSRLQHLYHGKTPDAVRFQIAALTLDLIVIGFFILTPVLRGEAHYLWIDFSIAGLLALDIVARTLASVNIRRRFLKVTVWVDILILTTLLFPYWLGNFGFLRILRLWSLSRSGVLWRPLERRGYHEWRDATHATVNLLTFLFVVSGFVYTNFAYRGYGIDGYVDALYFTVATVTTTGYGDITLPGIWGKLTAIAAMIIGISLFFRLAQAVFRPSKVTFPCPKCALQRHDHDAVHCKACGHQLRIPDFDD